ncbi:MAG: hypothetical protein H6706_13885 [Myxococcales bacterium]|nr:hypothetical protein [Myxococcales bacterium]
MLTIAFTHRYEEAVALRDAGYEPIECAFGQHGSVLGEHALDHHGTESHREGVALRACRDLYGARQRDPRFVVTGTPDADAVLAIVALAGLVPAAALTPAFYELVNRQDLDPIGLALLDEPGGVPLAWFNQQEHLTQSEEGFRKAIGHMVRLLTQGLPASEHAAVASRDRHRRDKAREGILARYDRSGLSLPVPEHPRTVLRGEAAIDDAARVLVVRSTVWGFDVWYRLAPVVVSYAARMAKVTVGCPDLETAELLFGPGGLQTVWPHLGKGWGGRETIGGSPRGDRLSLDVTHQTARTILPLLQR